MSENKSSYMEVLRNLLTSNFDNKPTKNEEYAEQLMNVHARKRYYHYDSGSN